MSDHYLKESGIKRAYSGPLSLFYSLLILFLLNVGTAFALERVQIESFDSHTRVSVLAPMSVRYALKVNRGDAKAVDLRFLTSTYRIEDVTPFRDPYGRVRRIEIEDGGSLLKIVSDEKISNDKNEVGYDFFAYRKRNPDRLVIDVWKKELPVAELKKQEEEKRRAEKEAIVSNEAIQKKALKKKASRKIASQVPNKKEPSKKKEFDKKMPEFHTLIWGYPFIRGEDARIPVSKKYTFPDENFKFSNAWGTRKADVHYQLAVNLYRDKDYALTLKTITLFRKRYPKSVYERHLSFLESCAMLRLEGTVQDVVYRKQSLEKLASVIDYNRDDELNLRAFQFLMNEFESKSQLSQAKEIYSAWANSTTKSEKLRSQAYKSLARLLYADSQYRESFLKFEKAAEYAKDPEEKREELFRALDSEAMAWAQDGNYNLAVRNYLEAEKKYSDKFSSWAPAHFNLAESLFRDKKYKEALKRFDEFSSQFPEHPWSAWAILRMGEIFEILDNPIDEVAELYKNVLNRFPFSKAAKIARSRHSILDFVRIARKKPEEAVFKFNVSQLEKIIESEKRSLIGTFAKLAKGKTLLGYGKYQDALNFFESLLAGGFEGDFLSEYRSDYSSSIESVISEKLSSGDYLKAVQIYEKNKDPYLKEAVDKNLFAHLSYAYFRTGEFEKGLKLLNNPPKNRVALIWHEPLPSYSKNDQTILKARLLLAKGKKNTARELVLSESLNLTKGSDQAHVLGNLILGSVAFSEENWKEAVNWLEPVFKNYLPDKNHFIREFPDSLVYLGASWMELGKYDEIQKTLKPWQDVKAPERKVASVFDQNTYQKERVDVDARMLESIHYMYADTFWYLRNHPAAIAKYNEFLSEFPSTKQWGRVKYNQAMSLITLGDKPQGKKILKEVISSDRTPDAWKRSAEVELSLLEMDEKYLR